MAIDITDFGMISSTLPRAIVEKKTASVNITGTLAQGERKRFTGPAIATSVNNPIVYFVYTNPRDIQTAAASQMVYANDKIYGPARFVYKASNNTNGYAVEIGFEVNGNTITPIAICTWDNGSGTSQMNNDAFYIEAWIATTPS